MVKSKKRLSWQLRLNDDSYRLVIRAVYRTSLAIPKIISVNELIGCLCFFLQKHTISEINDLYNLEKERDMSGAKQIYATSYEPMSHILDHYAEGLTELQGKRIYQNQVLLVVMREYLLQTDNDLREALKWSEDTISDC